MSREDAGLVLDQVRKILTERECRITDRELLNRFATNHDTESLAAVVQRHGPMVLSVCRRILFETHDVEDAVQATFLILVRKAGSNRWNESIGAWLHVVACRVALRLRRETRRWRSLETTALCSGDPLVEVSGRELCVVLDEELSRLGEKYRTPLVLCCLEGLTRDEAARHCDLSLDKLKRRLTKGRVLLRQRLIRRGFAPSAVMAAALCSQASARFVIPSRLVQAVMAAAVQVASSGGSALVLCSARASALAQSTVRASAVARLKLAVTATLVLFVAGAGVGLRLADAPSPQAIKVDKSAKEITAQAIETQNVVDKIGQSENKAATVPAGQDNSVEWPLFRRNSLRTAVGAGRAPLLKPSWSRTTLGERRATDADDEEVVLDKESRRLLETALHEQAQSAKPLLSGMVPIAVGGKVIYRNYVGIVAANRRTGKNEWDSSLILASVGSLLNDLNTRSDIEAWLKQYSDQSQQAVAFENSLVGTLSADHVHVYIVDDLALPPPTPLLGPGWWSPNITDTTLKYVKRSRLVALDLEGGKISWERGYPDHDSSQLALSHFFGPPLPIADRLYVLSEKNDEFRLVCLEPDEGKLVWSLKLDTVGVALPKDPRRRMHAAVLAYAGGVLVCPTNDGTVFGIDLVKRQAVWSFRYREKPKPLPAGKDDKFSSASGERKADAGNFPGEWRFPAAVIHGDHVVFTAPDSKPIYCLGLKDGVLRWKAEPRNDLYLAGVFNGKVVLVGSKSCRALDLADGTRQLWQIETGMPSGLGIANSSEYFLPLRNGELLTIDLARGAITHAAITARASPSKKQVLGNLIFGKDCVISQTETDVSCFPQKPKP